MRRSLLWMLGLVVLISAAALWIDEAPRLVAPLERRVALDLGDRDRARAPSLAMAAVSEPLPARIASLQVEPAKRDIFMPVVLPPPVAAPVSAPAVPPVVAARAAPSAAPATPPPPVAPTVTYRYLGSMTTPDGERIVLLARGETPVPVTAGTRLDEGYVVEAVSEEAVRLVYPALGSVVLVQIPQARTP